VWLLTVAVGVNLLPDLVSTSPNGRLRLAEFAARYLAPITEADHVVGSWGSDPAYNQSISGAGQRWGTTVWEWGADDCTISPCPPRVGPRSLRACVYGIQAGLLIVVLWACGGPFRPLSAAERDRVQGVECSLVLLLMLLLSPMSSKAHFGTLIVPGYCLARSAVVTGRRSLLGVIFGAVALAVLSNKDPLGERLYTLSLWYGVVTWQTLLLLGGCLVERRRCGAAIIA
jgi:hypothetical protein